MCQKGKNMADDKIQNPVKAIHAYCLECAGSYADVVNCKPTFGCQLWEFRMGTNPYRAVRTISEEHKQALIQGRLRKAKADEKSSL